MQIVFILFFFRFILQCRWAML